MVNTQTHKVEKCTCCNQRANHTSTLSPMGFWICNICGFRSSEIPNKLVTTQSGYIFKELLKKIIIQRQWI